MMERTSVASLESSPLTLRPVRNEDAQDLFGLIALCFADFPGCFVDPHDDYPDLLAPATAFYEPDSLFFVIECARGRVGASLAGVFSSNTVLELKRLYVRPDLRRMGLARRLIAHVIDAARARGVREIILWSDSRFVDAHRLYERLGYQRGESRVLEDISHSTEVCFSLTL